MQYHIEGMDCPSCVGKIKNALMRLSGVANIQLNFTTGKLEVDVAPNATTTPADIEKTIKSLGFGISVNAEPSLPNDENAVLPKPKRWWQSKKAKQVIGVGLLMGTAYLLAMLLPNYGNWLFTAAVVIGVIPFARKAVALALSGSPFSIEMLMSIAAIGALLIGAAEEAAAVVFLFSVGELLESVAANHARAGIKALSALMPKSTILIDEHGNQREVLADSLAIDDVVLVRAGDKVPADGVIVSGSSSLDESPITGESIPVAKTCGDEVFAGSINADGTLQVRVIKTATDNTISRIIELVEHAQLSKAPTARFIERFSHYYTPAVMVISMLVIVVPPLILAQAWGTWWYRGLTLLLIACPCALMLSTPAAIASGLAVATRRGLLIKGGSALETIGKVNKIVFDKTGTLTEGKPKVTDVVAFNEQLTNKNEVLALFASVEFGSSHPLAKAIVAKAEAENLAIPAATDSKAVAGKAVQAVVDGRLLVIGSPIYAANNAQLSEAQQEQIAKLQDEGKTVSVLFDKNSRDTLGLIALRDELRADAKLGIAQLKAMGVNSVMLTGDNKRTAKALAHDLNIDWQAELLPEDKLRLLNDMKASVKIAMVGDGINDAPALSAANVGIAMSGGTDVAIETADIALLKSQIKDVAHLVALSRSTMNNIHQNVIIALGLKGIFLITTIFGVTGLWIAVLADTGATVLVTLNALRLLRFKGH